MNDPPPSAGLTEKQSKSAVWRIAATSKLPASVDERIGWTERLDFKFRERQRAHQPGRVVALLVSVQHGLPATGHIVARHECCHFAPFVAVHEALDVAAVPRGLLRLHNCPDGLAHLLTVLLRFRGFASGCRQS